MSQQIYLVLGGYSHVYEISSAIFSAEVKYIMITEYQAVGVEETREAVFLRLMIGVRLGGFVCIRRCGRVAM